MLLLKNRCFLSFGINWTRFILFGTNSWRLAAKASYVPLVVEKVVEPFVVIEVCSLIMKHDEKPHIHSQYGHSSRQLLVGYFLIWKYFPCQICTRPVAKSSQEEKIAFAYINFTFWAINNIKLALLLFCFKSPTVFFFACISLQMGSFYGLQLTTLLQL